MIILSQIQLNKSYYFSFIFATFLCLSPFNSLGYIAPFLFIFQIILLSRSNRILISFLLSIYSCFLVCLFYNFIYIDRNYLGNGLLAIITYSSFLPIIAIPSKYFTDNKLLFKVFKVITIIIVLESCIGFIQSIYAVGEIGTFDYNAGDYIEGTIHPALESEKSMSNPIFSIIMSSLLVFLIANYKISKKGKFVIIFGFLVLLLASVIHVILFLLISYMLSLLYMSINKNRLNTIFKGMLIAFFCTIILKSILPKNFETIFTHARILIENKYPKTAVLFNYYNNVVGENQIINTVGLGPGQFLSRASFISTGKYFGTNSSGINNFKIPFTNMTSAFKDNVNDLWMRSINDSGFGSSSTSKPQSSWNAVITEFGLLGVVLFLAYFFILINRIKRNINNPHQYNLGFSLIWYLFFFLLLGFQENYWEIPQAIFIGFILSKLFYSIILYEKKIINIQ